MERELSESESARKLWKGRVILLSNTESARFESFYAIKRWEANAAHVRLIEQVEEDNKRTEEVLKKADRTLKRADRTLTSWYQYKKDRLVDTTDDERQLTKKANSTPRSERERD